MTRGQAAVTEQSRKGQTMFDTLAVSMPDLSAVTNGLDTVQTGVEGVVTGLAPMGIGIAVAIAVVLLIRGLVKRFIGGR